MKKALLLTLLVIMTLLVGLFSIKVYSLKSSYENSYTVAKQFEAPVLEGVWTGSLNLGTLESETLNTAIQEFNDHLDSIADEDNKLDGRVQRQTPKSITEAGTNVYYFFDDGDGSLEQLFVFRTVNGNILKLSLFWREGELQDVKTSIYI